MATDFSINLTNSITIPVTVTAPITGVHQARTGKIVTLRVSPYTATAYTATETPVTSGHYVFAGGQAPEDGYYKLYVDGVEDTSVGVFYVSDKAPTLTGLTMAGNIAMGGYKVTGATAATANGELVVYQQLTTLDASLNATLAALAISPFQESVNKVRVFPDGTIVTGKVYTTIKGGVTSFASPSVTNLCLVEIVGMGASASYITAAADSMVSYVNLKGSGKHIVVYFADITKTAVINIEGMTVLFGDGLTVGARAYNSVNFKDCTIWHYNNVTLTDGSLINCLVLGSSTYAWTLAGTTKAVNCQFNNAPTLSGSAQMIGSIDGFTYAPPTDPTIP